MATILQLKVAKRRLFQKVSLERCNTYRKSKDCFAPDKIPKSHHLEIGKNYVEAYWSSNPAAPGPEEKALILEKPGLI